MVVVDLSVYGVRSLTGGATNPGVDYTGGLRVNTTLPPLGELARASARYAANVANGATFKAPVTAWPTTTATWGLYNANAAGGPVFLIDTVAAVLASGTAGVGGSLIAAVSLQALTTIPTAFASTVVSNLNGGSNGSLAILANNLTIPGTQPAWHSLQTTDYAASTTIGTGIFADVKGGICVRPGYAVYLDVLSGTGSTALYGVSVTFSVVQMPLG